MPGEPHKAAVRAARQIIETPSKMSAIITREYTPLVEAAQDLCDQWGHGNVAFKVAALRAALEKTV